jgi:hypothetical protein
MNNTKCPGLNCKNKWHCQRFILGNENVTSYAEFNFIGKCTAQIKQECKYCGTTKSGVHKLDCETLKTTL